MILGQLNMPWLSKMDMAFGCLKELLIFSFSVVFSYGFSWGTLIETAIGCMRRCLSTTTRDDKN
jgi:hypothetical protein